MISSRKELTAATKFWSHGGEPICDDANFPLGSAMEECHKNQIS